MLLHFLIFNLFIVTYFVFMFVAISEYYFDQDIRSRLYMGRALPPDWMLINGKGPYMNNFSVSYESINVTQGKK